MSQLERDLETLFRREVRRAGGMPLKMIPVEKGVPDRLVLWPGGRVQLVELKKEDGTLDPLQVHWHQAAAQLGTTVVVLYGAQQIRVWARGEGKRS